MFMEMIEQRNPALLAAATTLHRQGAIGPDTWVIDRDAVVANARALAAQCQRYGIAAWFITKQIGRCPALISAVAQYLPVATAVDVREAVTVKNCGVRLGNVGHLVQIPRRQLPQLIDADHVTVYDQANLAAVAAAASKQQVTAAVLLKIAGGSETYPAQQGGFLVEQVPQVLRKLRNLSSVKVAGVTGFPCVLFDAARGEPQLTSVATQVLRAADLLRQEGIDPVVSLPSHSSCSTIPLVAAAGGTVVEPGHALTGTTPEHAVCADLAEKPAMVYVSEVLQTEPETVIAGGGFYARGHARSVRIRDEAAAELCGELAPLPGGYIDYYRSVWLPPGRTVALGATALLAFRSQLFATRSLVAVVAGVGARPELVGLYDGAGAKVSEGMR